MSDPASRYDDRRYYRAPLEDSSFQLPSRPRSFYNPRQSHTGVTGVSQDRISPTSELPSVTVGQASAPNAGVAAHHQVAPNTAVHPQVDATGRAAIGAIRDQDSGSWVWFWCNLL